MPESNLEVIIDGYVCPDIVTITLANDDFVGSRDYVSKDLYESVNSANDCWQAENAKLRELVHDALLARNNPCFWDYFEPYSFWTDWTNRACELGIEA